MAPRRFSRHTFCRGYAPDDADLEIDCFEAPWPGRTAGKYQLTEREPFRFREFADTRLHRVKQGDTLFTLAAHYFAPLPRPAGLWWVIADFQPQPIVDPTLRLRPGALVAIPSVRTVQEDIFNEARRRESNVT